MLPEKILVMRSPLAVEWLPDFGHKKTPLGDCVCGKGGSRTAKTLRRRCLLRTPMARSSAWIAVDPGTTSLAKGVPISKAAIQVSGKVAAFSQKGRPALN
jgi:hypothetical protein